MDGWRLLGTLTGRQDLALVQVKGENKLLSPGQTVQGWELSAIHPQTAVFKAKGRTYALRMWPPDPKAGQRPEPKRQQSVEPEISSRQKVSGKDIDQLIQNPNSLLQTAQFGPYSQNGEIQGFAVTRIKPDSLLDRLGLENKDVVTRIDGQPIHGPIDLLQAHSSLKQSSLVTLDILRHGEHKSFVVEIR
jgi:general secretion pathway protein C